MNIYIKLVIYNMRTGVLADSEAKHFFPMDQIAHERHLGVPHIAKHTRTTRKRKQGYRVTQRPRYPYLAHFELAQLMNPDNVRQSLEAFETHMFASMRPRPNAFFRNKVEDFKRKYPDLTNRAILDETAYFFETTKLDPMAFLTLPRSARRPLHIIVEEAVAQMGRGEELESAYNETMRLLLSESGFNVESKVEVKLEPDGVPSQTDARFERAEAASREAREERVNQARHMDGTY